MAGNQPGNSADPGAVLLVNYKYATSKDGSPTVNREVAQVLTGAGREVLSTVLEDTEEDRKAAEADGVKLILPTRNDEDPREPCLAWLTFDHVTRYPSLPQDVGCIVGHADVTSRAATAIKEQRFPQASLGLVIGTIPENTEKYKDIEEAMGIGRKEESIVQDAEKADTVFSLGHHIYDHFQSSFRVIPKDKEPTHYLFLPEPLDLFQKTTVQFRETREKIVLFLGGVSTVERLKGHDLAAKAMVMVAETSPDRIQYRVYGISKEEYQASMAILQVFIDSGKLIPTLLTEGTQEDICRHMQQAHLVIMPSRSEPFGLVGLQAMAAGVPVLISDQSGLATLVEKVTPEFHHSILEIEGDDSVDVTRWAGQIKKVLQKSEVEFKRAAALKDKLLKSRYWEESHQCLLQACGGPAVRVERTPHQLSGDVPHVNPVPDLPVYLSLGMEQQQPAGMQQPPAGMKQRHRVLFWVFLLSLVFLLPWVLQILKSLVQEPPWVLPWAVSWLLPLVFLLPWILPQPPPRVQQPMTEVQYADIYARIKEVERTMFTPEVLRDPALWVATCIRFLLHKAVLRGAVKGSFILLLRFLRQTDVDRFYHNHYRVGEGTLSQQLSHILISDELKDKVKGAQLIVRLQVKHEDYVRVRDRLGQGLKRTTSVDNLLALPPPSRQVDRSSLRGLDLAVASREDRPCTDGTDDVSALNFTAREVQGVIKTGRERLQQQIKQPEYQLQIAKMKTEDLREEVTSPMQKDKKTQKLVSGWKWTELYNNMLADKVKLYCKEEGVDMPTEGLPTEVAESLLQLGKLALEALLRNETLLDLTEVERENLNWELLLKLDVVSLEVSSSKLHPRKQLNFSDKSMQEFLAGRYVTHAPVNQDIVELLRLTSITKALELSNLLQFTCGCDSQAAQAVMEELCKLSSKEFSHLRPDDFKRSDVPVKPEVKKSIESYRMFCLLCFDILNERQELDVLHAVSRALPVVMFDNFIESRQHATLKYYLQNIQSPYLPDRVILGLTDHDTTATLQCLEQTFTSPIPGLKLDLELRHVTFNSPDQTARLVAVLKNVPGLRALDLPWAELTPSSLQPLVQAFRHMPLLEELDLARNRDLGDAAMEVLQGGLSSVRHLAVLRLRYVGMTAVGMSSLAPYLRHLVGLRELDITENGIGDNGLESLTAVLPIFTNMKVLVLMETGLSDRGISAFVKALPHLVQLQVLDVKWNHIGDSGIASIVQTLCQPSSLDVEQAQLDRNILATAPHFHNTLQKLYIGRNTRVTGAGLGRVAQLISALPALIRLDISGHGRTPAHLSDTAAMTLAEALPRLPALERLYLYEIAMEPAGFQAVLQAAEEHPTLEVLGFSPELVPEGADTTARCLSLAVSLH